MKIEFDKIENKQLDNFKGGEKFMMCRNFEDDCNKIMKDVLVSGASVGLHKHINSSEIIYILEGECKTIFDGKETRLKKGDVDYCPEGHEHTLINDTNEDVVYLAIVPNHNAR